MESRAGVSFFCKSRTGILFWVAKTRDHSTRMIISICTMQERTHPHPQTHMRYTHDIRLCVHQMSIAVVYVSNKNRFQRLGGRILFLQCQSDLFGAKEDAKMGQTGQHQAAQPKLGSHNWLFFASLISFLAPGSTTGTPQF